MLQQTNVAMARPYFEKFTKAWPDVGSLAAASDEEVLTAWAGLGYYARARNLIACARQVAAIGRFPDTEAELLKLPGVGRYTAAAIAAIAFDRRAVVVDGNVERVVARLFALKEELPGARQTLYQLANQLTPPGPSGDHAQAMMDLGATICTPRSPRCDACPLENCCAARAEGDPQLYPLKRPRTPSPSREGIAYWLQSDGKVLLVRRPGKGLLGGMLALPSNDWDGVLQTGQVQPRTADFTEAGFVDHIFTHFSLRMKLVCADAEGGPAGEGEVWWPLGELAGAGLPTLFAKLAARGVAWSQAKQG